MRVTRTNQLFERSKIKLCLYNIYVTQTKKKKHNLCDVARCGDDYIVVQEPAVSCNAVFGRGFRRPVNAAAAANSRNRVRYKGIRCYLSLRLDFRSLIKIIITTF